MKHAVQVACAIALVAGIAATQDGPVPTGDEARPKRTAIPGTAATIVLPAGFATAEGAPGFSHVASGASIVVTEIPGPFAALSLAFSPAALQTKGMSVVSRRAGMFLGHSGILVHAIQLVDDRRVEKRILLIGDDKASLMVNATVPESHARKLATVLHAAVTSVEWARKGRVDPFATAGFRLAVDGLRFAGRSGEELVFTNDGGIPLAKPGDARLIACRATPPKKIDSIEAAARARLVATPGLKDVSDVVAATIRVDDMEAIELTAIATAKHGGHPLAVYQLFAVAMDGSYVVTGTAGRANAKPALAAFRKTARSLKRSKR